MYNHDGHEITALRIPEATSYGQHAHHCSSDGARYHTQSDGGIDEWLCFMREFVLYVKHFLMRLIKKASDFDSDQRPARLRSGGGFSISYH